MKKWESIFLVLLFLVFIVVVICLLSILFYGISINLWTTPSYHNSDMVSIAAWNLQNFGPMKAGNDTLLNFYAEKLGDYDVFVIQEINDPAGAAILSFATKLPEYRYIISLPAGQGSSKEQYAIFYSSKVDLLHTIDWATTSQTDFERPPLEATFRVKNWTFTLFTIHMKVSRVPQEMTILEHLIGTPSTDTILLGDLNADGENYYNGEIHHFLGWHWLITSEMDTTVAKSSHAYDRIIINDVMEDNFVRVTIMTDVNANQTDHYLVSATFNPNET